MPWPLSSNGLLLLVTKFQPIRSSGWAVSPSWVLGRCGLAQPPWPVSLPLASTTIGARMSAGVDHAVAVDVGDLAGPDVDRVVQVAPGDVAVVVDVDQVLHPAGGDLGLVDPDVLVEVGVVVIDAGVDVGDDRGACPL